MAKMTEREVADALESHRLGALHQDAVRRTEAALDEIAAYLKQTKRKRPAPTRMFQYVGFRDGHFMQLVAAFQEANEAQDRAQHDWLHRDKNLESCLYCKARTALHDFIAAGKGGSGDGSSVESPIGTWFTMEEMQELLAEHFRGEHDRAVYDDCFICEDEREAA